MPALETNDRHLRLEQLEASLRQRLSSLQTPAPAQPATAPHTPKQLESAIRETLHQVDHALALLNRGFGDCCEICGQPIGASRLHAVPYATRCARCARDE